ncbi:hypothetical protein JXC34_00375 [Candidatus Woesearchaeota archaeon]|nr:hypothetical protein [Candidatus Woesearchaeota archaeon]
MKKELNIDPPVPHPKESPAEKPKPEPRQEPEKKTGTSSSGVNILIIYIIFLPLLIVAYVLNFERVTTETSVAAIGFNVGFVLAIIMPALLIWKQMSR